MATTAEQKQGVPLLDLKAQYARIRPQIEEAIREVCESQHFILGPRVAALEEELARYCHSAHAVGVSSGSDALIVALMALGVGPGDEVVTTPYTFFATAGAISRVGARPVFCDIDPDSYNLAPARVREFLTAACDSEGGRIVNKATRGTVKAILPVHLYGQVCEIAEICALADELGLAVVEDAAQAIGSEEAGGRRAGSRGSIGCFSFFPSKNLGAFGDGGLCTTSDDELAETMRVLRTHGGKPKYYHQIIGGNFRLDAIQAAIVHAKFLHLDAWTKQRQRNARRYHELLAHLSESGAVSRPWCGPGRHIFNQYVIRAVRRDELREFLSLRSVGTEIYYPVPLHLQGCFADLGYSDGDFPASERAAQETLALPIHPELTHAQIEYVAECIGDFYARG